MNYNINGTKIISFNEKKMVKDYYHYIISIIKYIVEKHDLSVNIILNNNDYAVNNGNKNIKINVNIEHTLVKENGRGLLSNTPIGKIKYGNNKCYYVRVVEIDRLNDGDIMIEYSNPNIYNVSSIESYNKLSKKTIYIAPIFYKNNYINLKNRNNDVITTFYNENEPRRAEMINIIKSKNLNYKNINTCFDKDDLQKLYQNTKILINIHQTPHHDTFEEFRCLPALQNGIIVVSEKSPLNHLIPYNDLIIWADYDNIVDKVEEILENYEEYYKQIFSETNIDILYNIDIINTKSMEDKIIKLSKKNKIFCIGFQKTGTTSFHEYFKNNSYSAKDDHWWFIKDINYYNQFDTFTDSTERHNNNNKVVFPDLKFLEENYDCKFIYQSRPLKDWLISRLTHNATEYRHGIDTTHNFDHKVLLSWTLDRNHWYLYIKEYFKNKNNLLFIDINSNSIDMELSNFLNISFDEKYYPFPNLNKKLGFNEEKKDSILKFVEEFLDIYICTNDHNTCEYANLKKTSITNNIYSQLYKNINQIFPINNLEIISRNFGLDKSIYTGCHNYIPSYMWLFDKIRYQVKNFLEIGIGSLENGQMGGTNGMVSKKYNYKTGNSLKCWSEYFSTANIYGIDIFAHPELNKDRIYTFVADQSNEQQLKLVIDKINSPLDIIIDDGSHNGDHQVFSFMYLHKYLAPNGIYVIEDVQPSNIKGFEELSIFPEHFKEYINQNFIVEYFDTRNSCNRHRADDFMISFTRK